MAIGARKFDVHFGGLIRRIRVQLGVHDGNGAEEEIRDVGEDGGAAGGDEVGSKEFVEFGEGVVDTYGGGEFVAIGGEAFEEVGVWLKCKVWGGVLSAETGLWVDFCLVAITSCWGTVAALRTGNGYCGYAFHEIPRLNEIDAG